MPITHTWQPHIWQLHVLPGYYYILAECCALARKGSSCPGWRAGQSIQVRGRTTYIPAKSFRGLRTPPPLLPSVTLTLLSPHWRRPGPQMRTWGNKTTDNSLNWIFISPWLLPCKQRLTNIPSICPCKAWPTLLLDIASVWNPPKEMCATSEIRGRSFSLLFLEVFHFYWQWVNKQHLETPPFSFFIFTHNV